MPEELIITIKKFIEINTLKEKFISARQSFGNIKCLEKDGWLSIFAQHSDKSEKLMDVKSMAGMMQFRLEPSGDEKQDINMMVHSLRFALNDDENKKMLYALADTKSHYPGYDSVYVNMTQVAFVNGNSRLHRLYTKNASSCIILAVYNEETQKSFMSHILGGENASYVKNKEVLDEWFDKISDMPQQMKQVHILGGEYKTRDNAEYLLEYINNRKDCRLVTKELGIHNKDNTANPKQLLLDSRDGSVNHGQFVVNNGMGLGKPGILTVSADTHIFDFSDMGRQLAI
jgi:hypothetical protein